MRDKERVIAESMTRLSSPSSPRWSTTSSREGFGGWKEGETDGLRQGGMRKV